MISLAAQPTPTFTIKGISKTEGKFPQQGTCIKKLQSEMARFGFSPVSVRHSLPSDFLCETTLRWFSEAQLSSVSVGGRVEHVAKRKENQLVFVVKCACYGTKSLMHIHLQRE